MSIEVVQFSPSQQRGIYVDRDDARLGDPRAMIQLMSSHEIEPRRVPVGVYDITPAYTATLQQYIMSRERPDGPVDIDFNPRRDDLYSGLYKAAAQGFKRENDAPKKITIPFDQPGFVLMTPTDFGQYCIHEIVAGFDMRKV